MKTPEQFATQLKTLEAELAKQDQAFAQTQQTVPTNCDVEFQVEQEQLDAIELAFKASSPTQTLATFNSIRA
jgi:hypothetical protein